MKAATYIYHGSPEVVQVKEVPIPTLKENQVMIKICAASVNALDSHIIRGFPSFLRALEILSRPKPKIPGVDLAGKVEAVGGSVTRFKAGDEVFGVAYGAFAEFAANENKLAHKPENRSFQEMAAVPVAAVSALQGLRDHGQVKPGQKVLIQGAGGGVGMFAVQIAKILGAEVTAVCSNRNAEIIRSAGADHVVDYEKEDFTRGENLYDLILAVNGYHPVSAYRKVLKPNGLMVMIGTSKSKIFKAMFQVALMGSVIAMFGKQRFKFFIARVNLHDLLVLKEWAESGKLKSIIDRQFALDQAAEAIHYLEAGHVKGKIVVEVE